MSNNSLIHTMSNSQQMSQEVHVDSLHMIHQGPPGLVQRKRSYRQSTASTEWFTTGAYHHEFSPKRVALTPIPKTKSGNGNARASNGKGQLDSSHNTQSMQSIHTIPTADFDDYSLHYANNAVQILRKRSEEQKQMIRELQRRNRWLEVENECLRQNNQQQQCSAAIHPGA